MTVNLATFEDRSLNCRLFEAWATSQRRTVTQPSDRNPWKTKDWTVKGIPEYDQKKRAGDTESRYGLLNLIHWGRRMRLDQDF